MFTVLISRPQPLRYRFEALVDYLPEPYLTVGDFSAHHPPWQSASTVTRECLLEKFLLSSGTCLLNIKDSTYYNTAHKTH